jgi:hypothetical protein
MEFNSRFVYDLNGAPVDLDDFELLFTRKSLQHFVLRTSIQYWNENGNCYIDMPAVFVPCTRCLTAEYFEFRWAVHFNVGTFQWTNVTLRHKTSKSRNTKTYGVLNQ